MKNHAVLTVTTFWSIVLEFPRDGLNWAPVRTVSPEQSPQTNVCATEIAILHSSCRGDFSGAVCHDILNESVRVLGQQAVMESMWTSRWGTGVERAKVRACKTIDPRVFTKSVAFGVLFSDCRIGPPPQFAR